MFKKEFTVAHKTICSKKDVKELKHSLLEKHPNLQEKDLAQLLPAESSIHCYKCDNRVILYLPDKQVPTFFDDGNGELYPTLHTLWRFPHMMFELTIYPEVSKYILNGADLMLQGVIPPSNGVVGLGPVTKGQLRCVTIEGNPYPIAVGNMLVNKTQMEKLLGKGLQVVHCFGDQLWAYCGKICPNAGFKEGAEEITACTDKMVVEADATNGNGTETPVQAEAPATSDPSVDLPPDDLLEYCFLQACKKAASQGIFPAKGDDFYLHHMLPLRPEGTTLDVKKTSHKQLSKFYNSLRKQKCLEVTEKKGVVTLVSCNLDHKVMKAMEEKYGDIAADAQVVEAKKTKSEAANTVKVTTVYSPNVDLALLYKEVGVDKKKLMTLEEALNSVLRAHLEKHNLVEDKKVKVDEALIDSLYKVSRFKPKDMDEFPTEANVASVEEIFTNRLDEHTTVEVEGHGTVTKKGPLQKIEVHLTRKGGHNLSRLVGLENFSLNVDVLAQDLKKQFNCTTTVEELPGKQTKDKMLQIQGHVDNEIKDYLLSSYGIPNKYIVIKN